MWLKNTEIYSSDLIAEIFNRGSGNIPRTTNPTLKRSAPQDEDCGSNTNAPSPDEQLEQLERSIKQTDHLFSLPLYTQELGLLPVYESFDFQFNLDPNQVPPLPTDFPDSGFAFLPVDASMAFGNGGSIWRRLHPAGKIGTVIYSVHRSHNIG
ncbi:hypothetical protein DFH06DRAFT_1223841, partial [Mycena polygramma]